MCSYLLKESNKVFLVKEDRLPSISFGGDVINCSFKILLVMIWSCCYWKELHLLTLLYCKTPTSPILNYQNIKTLFINFIPTNDLPKPDFFSDSILKYLTFYFLFTNSISPSLHKSFSIITSPDGIKIN